MKIQNSKFKLKIKNYSAGFTLIEVLVVLIVLLVVGSILVTVLVSSLRGANKVNSIETVRKNGNYAINQMSKTIKYSQFFEGVSSTPNGTYIRDCTILASAYTPPVYAAVPSAPSEGFFSKLANLMHKFIDSPAKVASFLAALIPKINPGNRNTARVGPRREVAGATNQLGWTSVGGTGITATNRLYLARITVPAGKAGSVSNGQMYIGGVPNTGDVYMVVYNDSSLTPGSIRAVSNKISFPQGGSTTWFTLSFPSSFNIIAGENLWLGWYIDGSGTTSMTNGQWVYADPSLPQGDYANANYFYLNWGDAPVPNSFSGSTQGANPRSWSEYLNVVAPDNTLNVNSSPVGDVSIGDYYGTGMDGTTDPTTKKYTKPSAGTIATILVAPGSFISGGTTYNFSSATGCQNINGPDNTDSFCDVYVTGGQTQNVTINFTAVSTPTPTPTRTPTPTPTLTPAPTSTPGPTPTPAIYHYVKLTGFDGGTTYFHCDTDEIASYSGSLSNTPVKLVDTSTVSITSCAITCNQSTSASPPTIGISFNLLKGFGGTPAPLSENQASETFQTSVSPRNYLKY